MSNKDMPMASIEHIRIVAREELRQEVLRAAIDAEKKRILERRTTWAQLLNALPFVITFK